MKQVPPPSRELLTKELYDRYSRRGLWRQRLMRPVHTFPWLLLLSSVEGMKRALDFCLSLSMILALSPLIAYVAVFRPNRSLPLFAATKRAGRWCEPFDELSFSDSPRVLRRLPLLFNILKGDMSFIGPRAVPPGELTPRERAARKRYNARPGLICLWWIRKRANIAYSGETDSDSEYVESQTLRGDFGIALRALPALLYGEGVVSEDSVRILDVTIHNMTMSDSLDWITRRIANPSPGHICFFNADCANIASRDPNYRTVLNQAELVLADGIGLKLAGKLLASPIRQNVNGTDMFPRLCEAVSGTGAGIFLLGALPGVADKVRDWVAQHHPDVIVSGCRDGYFTAEQEREVVYEIAQSGAAVLLVAFGAPRQDLWIRRHLNETGVKVAMGVGGLFDFYSGRIPRAPLWMREIGAEWLFRFAQEPRRMWKRYFVGNAVFLWRVLRARRRRTPGVGAV